ncbi:MAG TPA: sialate O-acetylesterase, partial [Prolixibacteraceae bacterium]|nr:sialate O-acetylesterase [Prolixibacteraceae bacterium]
KYLYTDLQIPIGIINTSYGGSRIEAWMSEEMLGYDEDDVSLLAWDKTIYQERQPTLCYNQMLKPLEGFAIKGFIWYQGESNADYMDDAKEYGALFKKMITSWRNNWGLGDLPFIWVQLPNYSTVYDTPQAWDTWPILRANQSATLSLPNTGEAVTIDIGAVDIHPTNKKPVGERLALCARKIAYKEDLVYSGPRYKSHQLLPDGKIVIKYEQIGGGLVAKNSTDGTVNGFAVADSAGNLSWANASIQGDSVVVWNDNVKNPSLVRYAWETNPATINLYNAEGLPAAPFKAYTTDPGFVIKSFTPTASTIERWETTVLTWETYGASSVTLDNETVDPNSGKRVQPMQTTSYTLKINSQQYPDSILTKTVTIEVVDPKPTISIKTDVAGITSPGTEITLIATATAPRERTIKQIDFYIDDVLVGTDTTSPYELKWTPTQAGNFSFTAKVTDDTDVSVTSAPSSIYVTKLKMLIYEAEKATVTGTGSVKTNKNVSNGKYLDMNSNGWLITFDNVEAPADGVYPLSIRYLLNYESPKSQVLIVNDNNLGEIKFTAPNTSTWSTYALNVTLNKGLNTIQIKDSWGWMSFDYIAIAVEDTSTTGAKKMEINQGNSLFYNLNNPVRSSTNITYLLPRDGKVTLDLYSSDGKKIKTLVNEMKTAGTNSARLDASQLKAGVYLLKIQFGSMNETKKIVVVK